MTPSTKDNHVNTSRVSRCPVCAGKGRVPYGFYVVGTYETSSVSTDFYGEICRSCYGKGIIIH